MSHLYASDDYYYSDDELESIAALEAADAEWHAAIAADCFGDDPADLPVYPEDPIEAYNHFMDEWVEKANKAKADEAKAAYPHVYEEVYCYE